MVANINNENQISVKLLHITYKDLNANHIKHHKLLSYKSVKRAINMLSVVCDAYYELMTVTITETSGILQRGRQWPEFYHH